MPKLLKQCVITAVWEVMKMSNYIIHSSGEWKHHKWIRREGGPGNYKYYYKTASSGNSYPSPRHSSKSHGSGVADTEHDKAFDLSRSNTYPITGAGKYYEAQKFDKDRKKKINAETKRRAIGDAYRNQMVNRMIDAMSGKTVTQFVSNVYHVRLDPVRFHSDKLTGQNVLRETTKVTKIVDHYKGDRNYNGKKKYQQQLKTSERIRNEQSSKSGETPKAKKFIPHNYVRRK